MGLGAVAVKPEGLMSYSEGLAEVTRPTLVMSREG